MVYRLRYLSTRPLSIHPTEQPEPFKLLQPLQSNNQTPLYPPYRTTRALQASPTFTKQQPDPSLPTLQNNPSPSSFSNLYKATTRPLSTHPTEQPEPFKLLQPLQSNNQTPLYPPYRTTRALQASPTFTKQQPDPSLPTLQNNPSPSSFSNFYKATTMTTGLIQT